MTEMPTVRPPGVFVLGMHRSGTSVMAGVLDRLGLDGGPRESMFEADEFNSDGYWEQRPLVEMHDRMLQRLGGFASAPPPTRSADELRASLPRATTDIETLVATLFDGPWFVKDPRHCLLLPLWTSALGADDLAIVVLRSPDAVVRSLQRRNGYSTALALGLWERYMLDLLTSLVGRPSLILRYEDLVHDPYRVVSFVAGIVRQHVATPIVGSIEHAASLVRDRPANLLPIDERSSDVSRRLMGVLGELVGYHPRFALRGPLPLQSPSIRRRLTRRRVALRLVGSVIGHDAVSRSQLDRRLPTGRTVR